MKSLVIIPGKAAWTLYVDALVLNDGGGVLGALSAAALAALAATRLPKVTISKRCGLPCKPHRPNQQELGGCIMGRCWASARLDQDVMCSC